MDKKHADKLARLAKHLEKGKLGHKIFDIRVYNTDVNQNKVGPTCGTVGCALGELPVLFPDQWKFSPRSNPMLINKSGDGFLVTDESAEEFFGIHGTEVNHLFYHGQQDPRLGGVELEEYATKEEVASNIWAFLEVKGYKKSDFKDVKL